MKSGDRIKVGILGLEVQLTVGVGGQKKPEVHSVQEAAARTVAAAAATDDDFDVSRWLGEDDDATVTPSRKQPSVGEDTMAGKSLIDTAAIPIPPPHKEDEKKKEPHPPAKAIGKIIRTPKPTTETSGAAADDALRHFFHRKKP